MSTLRQRAHRKNDAGTYDVIHLETSSNLVLRPDGKNIESAMTNVETDVTQIKKDVASNPAPDVSESVPKTLNPGKIVIVGDTIYIGDQNGNPREVMLVGGTYNIGNIGTFSGMTMEEILDKVAIQNSMSNGENASKYGYMVKFVDYQGNPLVNFPVYKVANGTVESNLCGYTNKNGTLTMMLADAMDLYLYCPDNANRKYAFGRVISGMGQIASETLKADKKFELRVMNGTTPVANTVLYKHNSTTVTTSDTFGTTDTNGYIPMTSFMQGIGNKMTASATGVAFHSSAKDYVKGTVNFSLGSDFVATINTVIHGIFNERINAGVGQVVTFNGAAYRIVHIDSSKIYAACESLPSTTKFGSNTVYNGSTLASVALAYENALPADLRSRCSSVTVNGVTAKVFVASYEQMNGGFSYFNSNDRRKCPTSGTAAVYWTSSPRGSSSVYYVYADGGFNGYSVPSSAYGFRPFVAMPIV